MEKLFIEKWIRILSVRRSIVLGIIVIPLGFLLAGAVLSPKNQQRYNNFSADGSSSRDPLLGLADRSPGFRTGDTLQKKPYNRPPVFERVLSEVREPVPFDAPLAFGPLDLLGTSPASLMPDVPDQFSFLGPSEPVGLGPLPVQPGSVDYPAVGGPPTSAVPETSTWAMMIIGFFGCGLVVRRRAHDQQRRRNYGEESHGCQ